MFETNFVSPSQSFLWELYYKIMEMDRVNPSILMTSYLDHLANRLIPNSTRNEKTVMVSNLLLVVQTEKGLKGSLTIIRFMEAMVGLGYTIIQLNWTIVKNNKVFKIKTTVDLNSPDGTIDHEILKSKTRGLLSPVLHQYLAFEKINIDHNRDEISIKSLATEYVQKNEGLSLEQDGNRFSKRVETLIKSVKSDSLTMKGFINNLIVLGVNRLELTVQTRSGKANQVLYLNKENICLDK